MTAGIATPLTSSLVTRQAFLILHPSFLIPHPSSLIPQIGVTVTSTRSLCPVPPTMTPLSGDTSP